MRMNDDNRPEHPESLPLPQKEHKTSRDKGMSRRTAAEILLVVFVLVVLVANYGHIIIYIIGDREADRELEGLASP